MSYGRFSGGAYNTGWSHDSDPGFGKTLSQSWEFGGYGGDKDACRGLKRLEYRGYDSAGIAIPNGGLKRLRRVGRVAEMEAEARAQNSTGAASASATRAGPPTAASPTTLILSSRATKSPWCTTQHHREPRGTACAPEKPGYHFESQTDTEVICAPDSPLTSAAPATCLRQHKGRRRTRGRLCDRRGGAQIPGNDLLWRAAAARCSSAWATARIFRPPDVLALLPVTRRVIYLEEGDARVTRAKVTVVDRAGLRLRAWCACPSERYRHARRARMLSSLRPYRHYMHLGDKDVAVVESGAAPFGVRAVRRRIVVAFCRFVPHCVTILLVRGR